MTTNNERPAASDLSVSAGSATIENYRRASVKAVCEFTAHESGDLDYFMQNGLLMHKQGGETFITDQSGNGNHLKQNASSDARR